MTVLEFPNQVRDKVLRERFSDLPVFASVLDETNPGMTGYVQDEQETGFRLYKVKGKGREYLNCHYELYGKGNGSLICKGTFRNGWRVGFWHNFDEGGRVKMKRFFNDVGEERLSEHYYLLGTEARLASRYTTRQRNEKISLRHQGYDPRGLLTYDYEYFNYSRSDEVCIDYVETICNDPWPYYKINDEIPEGLPTYEYHTKFSEWSPEEKHIWRRRCKAGCHQKDFVNGVLRSKKTWVNA